MIVVTIPTCKDSVKEQVRDIIKTTGLVQRLDVYATEEKLSASQNRNLCIEHAMHWYESYLIMLDDDITGFYREWAVDLITPLIKYPYLSMVSARLIKKDGTRAPMMGDWNGKHTAADVIKAQDHRGRNHVCSACIAMRTRDIKDLRFDENFIGSGYEDNDWCQQLNLRYPEKHIAINNRCRLIHLNEAKNQGSKYNDHNKAYYAEKWGE